MPSDDGNSGKADIIDPRNKICLNMHTASIRKPNSPYVTKIFCDVEQLLASLGIFSGREIAINTGGHAVW